jgi:hypothetical protein
MKYLQHDLIKLFSMAGYILAQTNIPRIIKCKHCKHHLLHVIYFSDTEKWTLGGDDLGFLEQRHDIRIKIVMC